MRKDVRLGLAVGGIIISFVLVYAIFFTGPKDNNTNQTAGGNGSIDVTAPNPGPAPHVTVTPGAESVAQVNPGAIGAAGTPNATGTVAGTGALAAGNSAIPTGPLVSPGSSGASGQATEQPASSGNVNPSASEGSATTARTAPWSALLEFGENARTETPGGPLGRNADIAGAGNERPTAGGAGPREYVVKPGETYWTIAAAQYGNGAYFSHLIRANPRIDPNRLKAGAKIVLPDKSEVVPAAAAASAAAAQGNRAVDPATQYRVQANDNLTTISKKLYGRTDRVNKLYELNKELIGPNPSALKKDMVLRLPEAPATSTTPAIGAAQ